MRVINLSFEKLHNKLVRLEKKKSHIYCAGTLKLLRQLTHFLSFHNTSKEINYRVVEKSKIYRSCFSQRSRF